MVAALGVLELTFWLVQPAIGTPPFEKVTDPTGPALPDPEVTVAASVTVWFVTAVLGATASVIELLAMTTALRTDAAGAPAPPVFAAVSTTAMSCPTSAAVNV